MSLAIPYVAPTVKAGRYNLATDRESIADELVLLSQQWAYAVKSADSPGKTNNTLAADPDLFLGPLPASSVWEVRCTGIYVGNDTGDFAYNFTFPSGARLSGHNAGAHAASIAGAATSGSVEFWGRTDNASPSTLFGLAGSTTDLAFTFMGLLIMGTTAGNFQLQWSQVTTNATATILRKGSHLVMRRVDS
jgi:hypothetical protein